MQAKSLSNLEIRELISCTAPFVDLLSFEVNLTKALGELSPVQRKLALTSTSKKASF